MRILYIALVLASLAGCARPCCLHGCRIQEWRERHDHQYPVYESWLTEELGMEE